MDTFQRIAAAANSIVQPVVLSPRWGRLFTGRFTVITYTGRRSGRTISTPVAYVQKADQVSIKVMMPDQKTWWRNFIDSDGSISMQLHGVERHGKANAVRDARGKVTVTVDLEPTA